MKTSQEVVVLDILLSPDATSLSEVTVTAVARKDTEVAMIEEERQSDVVQTDNIVIVKSSAPEYPSDFTGGFVMIRTKYQSTHSGFDISLGTSVNDMTHFRDFKYYKGGGRYYHGQFGSSLMTYPGYSNRIDVLGNGFSSDWKIYNRKPIGDLKLNASYNNRWRFESVGTLGLLGSFNFSDSYRTMTDMENSLYGPYDITNDLPVYLRKANDNQYTRDTKLGGMLNVSFLPQNHNHRYEWKTIYNRIVKNRYSDRTGFNAQPDNIEEMEYYYSTRNTLNTQITGRHEFSETSLWDWSAGYAYSDRDMPDPPTDTAYRPNRQPHGHIPHKS